MRHLPHSDESHLLNSAVRGSPCPATRQVRAGAHSVECKLTLSATKLAPAEWSWEPVSAHTNHRTQLRPVPAPPHPCQSGAQDIATFAITANDAVAPKLNKSYVSNGGRERRGRTYPLRRSTVRRCSDELEQYLVSEDLKGRELMTEETNEADTQLRYSRSQNGPEVVDDSRRWTLRRLKLWWWGDAGALKVAAECERGEGVDVCKVEGRYSPGEDTSVKGNEAGRDTSGRGTHDEERGLLDVDDDDDEHRATRTGEGKKWGKGKKGMWGMEEESVGI
ncbi:hypothetical protein DFP72DRAFT_859017 [Ephemerocybe angulata]|uniref:Uncharacterized protein n=1 Tax=Ephemerocybe angulata TaxID=980116 RepID=A0A8H6LTK2_9AGAR|nr:hypothetical protein DFP72DRAFT_859017 [Tulosesus angulatus]